MPRGSGRCRLRWALSRAVPCPSDAWPGVHRLLSLDAASAQPWADRPGAKQQASYVEVAAYCGEGSLLSASRGPMPSSLHTKPGWVDGGGECTKRLGRCTRTLSRRRASGTTMRQCLRYRRCRCGAHAVSFKQGGNRGVPSFGPKTLLPPFCRLFSNGPRSNHSTGCSKATVVARVAAPET